MVQGAGTDQILDAVIYLHNDIHFLPHFPWVAASAAAQGAIEIEKISVLSWQYLTATLFATIYIVGDSS